MHLRYPHIILALILIFVFLPGTVKAQTKAQCDSLIEKGKEATRNKDYVKSLELLSTARAIAEKNRWNVQLFNSINNTVANYVSMMDYGEALNYCLEAYNLSVKELGPEYEMRMLNNIAILYTADKNYQKAQGYYKKAADTAKEENYKSFGIYLINLANIENILENPKQARQYIQQAMPNLKKHWPKSIIAANMILAESDLLDGNTNLAREKAENLLKQKKDVVYNDIEIPLNEIIIKSYFKENNFDKATQTANSIFSKKPDLETKKGFLNCLQLFTLRAKLMNWHCVIKILL